MWGYVDQGLAPLATRCRPYRGYFIGDTPVALGGWACFLVEAVKHAKPGIVSQTNSARH